ncbi:MAG: carbamoyltransferase HypF [Candidatus Eisenbacteria bacterium]
MDRLSKDAGRGKEEGEAIGSAPGETGGGEHVTGGGEQADGRSGLRAAEGLDARYELRVLGLVQGVGFRPFVARLARGLGLTGHVINDGRGVFIDIEGPPARLDEFVTRLTQEAPPLSRITTIEKHVGSVRGNTSFVIKESESPAERFAFVSPDIATCRDCLDEMHDPSERRRGYPFINCTNCGPRFTIVKDIPYDRIRTTMREFEMCGACSREYTDDSDRRFHAEPIACPVCGPAVRLVNRAGAGVPGEPLERTVELLREGAIVAVKGLGGYHLACDAANSLAVSTLRKRKCREEKPLAIIVRDVELARSVCEVSAAEEALLASRERPIVLLRKRERLPAAHGETTAERDGRPFARETPPPTQEAASATHGELWIAEEVAPGNKYLGVMLPYTPLHHLLMEGIPALVMTSGNLTDEPLAYKDEEALVRLGTIADYFLVHNREIFTRCDDSVARIVKDRVQMTRRSRGHVPNAVRLPFDAPPILAVGAELKNTFCLTRGNLAFPGHHIGDLKNVEAYEAFKGGIEHLKTLLFIKPQLVAHDMHPDYLSTRYARQSGLPLKAVQHHHAHIASCMAENGITGKVLGLSFDGTGYGPDGTVWGGEFLIADFSGYERVAHLKPVALPGGEAAINEPWRMAVSYLYASAGGNLVDLRTPLVERMGPGKLSALVRMVERRVNSPMTSSVGRLFDAVSSLAGLRDSVSFEGQAAMELEMAASDTAPEGFYPFKVVESEPGLVLDLVEMVRLLSEEVGEGSPAPAVSRKFHESLARAVGHVCRLIHEKSGIKDVCLSGGVFQNALLSTLLVELLEKDGFAVYVHSLVPPNDGGLALGQAAVASFDETAQ